LARVDGATIVDRNGRLLAFGAIVHSFESGSEGARTAAARALSTRVSVAIAVSQDGPITVFVDGRRTLEFF
jgi:DNA integrity scanning protein DisA with diadenylate cyclase activity